LEYRATRAQLIQPEIPLNSSSNFINKIKNENGNGLSIYINNEINMKILNLMTFEDLHNWLAPTGDMR
jgi:hypothetical protein